MPKPTAAANAAPMPEPTRRAFLKAGGALGTVAALAVPVAVLPKAEAAEQADAALLAMGRELETLWERERGLAAEGKRLDALTEQTRPAPEPKLLAYQRGGKRLLEEKGGRFWVNYHLYDWLRAYGATWNSPTLQQQSEVAQVLAALERWDTAGRETERAIGETACDEEHDRVTDAISALCDRIVAEPARTPAGLAVKLRALDWCYPDSSHAAAIKEQIDDEDEVTSVRLTASVLADTLRLLGQGGAHV
ncbi:twin-arginine translocation signal domain-containing protein [Xanthobacter autotrophicus]|uniref:twin-arginine translocation signal domain-containing protein n=1 Tax=Xanthobacter autotrophicus TaxID=280 RepID=UPI0024A73F97|nr:twin-arginine translocation signal domain-containing protein [Xanthobacter autotrophicus]MDI4655535.1 twin-arginine translocation signal domain-containing protein [Xanthobacter autotrophicus]